ncbi:MAG TPA: nuclear transport factor 2 family protein [Chthoniobacterales bacterium]|jgi:ketosteroid isomerase-like protein|nr:nuclear transport factor 2 family protein [Chthoniobacterales bacterium]
MKILGLGSVIILGVGAAFAAEPSPNTPRAKGESEIIQLEQRWMTAMKERDEKTLNQLVAPEFTLSGIDDPEEPALPRKTWIDNTLHNLTVESFSFVKTRVQVAGDTAIVHAIFTWKGVFKEPFTDTVSLIDVWVRRNGNWQVVSRFVGEGSKDAH